MMAVIKSCANRPFGVALRLRAITVAIVAGVISLAGWSSANAAFLRGMARLLNRTMKPLEADTMRFRMNPLGRMPVAVRAFVILLIAGLLSFALGPSAQAGYT